MAKEAYVYGKRDLLALVYLEVKARETAAGFGHRVCRRAGGTHGTSPCCIALS
jgi:hypothetical protein